MFESLKNQEIPRSCSYKECITLCVWVFRESIDITLLFLQGMYHPFQKFRQRIYEFTLWFKGNVTNWSTKRFLNNMCIWLSFWSTTWWLRMIVNKIFSKVSYVYKRIKMLNIYRQNVCKPLGVIPKRRNSSKHTFWCNFKFQIWKKNFYIISSGNQLHDVAIDYIDSRTWKTILTFLKETWRLDLN